MGVFDDVGAGSRSPIKDGSAIGKAVTMIWLMVIGVGVFLWFQWSERRLAEAARSWPMTSGEVVESRIVQGHTGRGHVYYRPRVSYRYTVAGTVYTGRRIQFSEQVFPDDEDEAQRTADRFPLENEVQVSYRPDNPRDSVLEPGFRSGTLLNVSIAAECLFLGFAIFDTAARARFQRGLAERRAAAKTESLVNEAAAARPGDHRRGA
jgi:hypothetical protein